MAKWEGDQNIPAKWLDAWRSNLTDKSPKKITRKRYPYRMRLFQEGKYKVTPAQKAQREKFKVAVARWENINWASRQFLFDWCKSSGLWYFDFYIRQRLYPMPNFEGKSDIDANVIRRLYVHLPIPPIQVNLYLYGAKFNAQFYTELGRHNHGMTGASGSEAEHTHTIPDHHHAGVTASHFHAFEADQTSPEASDTDPEGGDDDTENDGSKETDVPSSHTHATGGYTVDQEGVDGGAISTVLKDYFDHMTIEIDGVDKTAEILALVGWSEFGDGTSGHAFNGINGTGKIDITNLINWTVGQHYIDFKQSGNDGGRLRYALYFD